jgi:hypothetical protein
VQLVQKQHNTPDKTGAYQLLHCNESICSPASSHVFDGACTCLQDAATRNAMAGQEEVSQSLASAQARIKVLEANLAEAHATVRHTALQQQLPYGQS